MLPFPNLHSRTVNTDKASAVSSQQSRPNTASRKLRFSVDKLYLPAQLRALTENPFNEQKHQLLGGERPQTAALFLSLPLSGCSTHNRWPRLPRRARCVRHHAGWNATRKLVLIFPWLFFIYLDYKDAVYNVYIVLYLEYSILMRKLLNNRFSLKSFYFF